MECFVWNILLQLLKLDRKDVVEQLSYDGNLSKQMPLEPSYILFFFFVFFCANLNVITHTRNEKNFSPTLFSV